MVDYSLFNFLLHNLWELKLSCVVLFHCWNQENLQQFAVASSHHQFYSQYVNLKDIQLLDNFDYRYLRWQRPKMAVFMDMNCIQTENLINQTSHLRLFNQHYHWLIYDQFSNIKRFYGIFKSLNLSVDTDVTYVVPKQTQISLKSQKTSFITFDVYNNGWFIGGSINITSNYEIECNKTLCQRIKYLSDLHKRSLYGNRNSLRDVTMRVAAVVTRYDLNAPTAEINEFLLSQKDFHIDPLARLGMQVLKLLQESLYTNVSYAYHDRWTDIEYTGAAVGALVTDAADLSSAPFVISANRLRFLSPIAPTGEFRTVCMFRTPRNAGIHDRVFLEPFSSKVWILFGGLLTLAAISLWLAFFVEFHNTKRYLVFIPSLLTTFLIAFGSACSQSSFLIPSSMGGRIAFISLSLISFIMYNYYTSMVVSSLVGSPVKSKLKTLGDLTDSNLDIGLEPLPYTFAYLNFSKIPEVRRFVQRKIETKKNVQNVWHSTNDGIIKLRNEPGFVFIFELSNGFNLIEKLYDAHEICDLNEILFRPDTQLTTHLHKNSSYKEIVRLKILETGLHSKHRRQWVRTHLHCFSNNFVINVGMEYAAPLFLLLVCSYLMVFMIYLFEILWSRHDTKKHNLLMQQQEMEHGN